MTAFMRRKKQEAGPAHLERANACATAPPQQEEDDADLLHSHAHVLDGYELLLERLAAELDHEQEDEGAQDAARADRDRVESVLVGTSDLGPRGEVHQLTRRRSQPHAAHERSEEVVVEAVRVDVKLDLAVIERLVDVLGHGWSEVGCLRCDALAGTCEQRIALGAWCGRVGGHT
jgi:hypothetical protein